MDFPFKMQMTMSTSPIFTEFYVSPAGDDRWSGRLPEPNAEGNDGPFATIAHAQKAARRLKRKGELTHPVRIVLRGGTYALTQPLTLTPGDAGSPAPKGTWNTFAGPERSVTYAAYPGEPVVLSGGERITGWVATTINGRDAWMTTLPDVKRGKWNFTQLWVNGRRARRPRLPRQGFYHIVEPLGEVVWEGDPTETLFVGQDRFRFRDGDLQAWHNLGDVEMVALHYWIESRINFKHIDLANQVATLQWKSRMRLSDDFDKRGAPYYVENVFEALDEPGQWYLDRPTGRLYYLPHAGEDMTTAEVIAPRLAQLVRIQGDAARAEFVAHVRFEGLTFSHTEWTPGEERHTATPQAACHVPGAIVIHGAHDIVFERCTIAHVGSYGLEVNGASYDVSIVGCTITDLGGGGVKVWHDFAPHSSATPGAGPDMNHTGACRRILISDNEIGDGGYRYHQAVGVLIGRCSGVQVLHNHIHDFDYTGVSVGWRWGYEESNTYGNVIEYNHIHHIGRGMLSDMGGIYTLGVQPGTRLRYNLIHDVESRGYGGWGIYNDEGSSYILIENNLVYRTRSNGYNQHYGRDNIVRNNIFALGRRAQFSRSRIEPHTSFIFTHNIIYFEGDADVLDGNWQALHAIVDHNLYFNASGGAVRFAGQSWSAWRRRGADRHSLIADPMFKNPKKGDFRLQPGSPAEKMGFRLFDLSTVGPRPEYRRVSS